jgi:hypothetical protein
VSTRVTLRSSRFATHNAPPPDAIATGRAPTGTVAVIEPDESNATIEFATTDARRSPPLVARTVPVTAAITAMEKAAIATRLREEKGEVEVCCGSRSVDRGVSAAAALAVAVGASRRPR